MAWGTAGILTNPAAGTVLADTGALSTPFVPTIICWTSVACLITLRHRNAANNGDLHTQQMSVATFVNEFVVWGIPTQVTLGAGERLQITLDADIVGKIQCSIITT